MDLYITQLKAQGPARTCNESYKEERTEPLESHAKNVCSRNPTPRPANTPNAQPGPSARPQLEALNAKPSHQTLTPSTRSPQTKIPHPQPKLSLYRAPQPSSYVRSSPPCRPPPATAEQRGNNSHAFQDLCTENGCSQGQNRAVASLFAPSSLDSSPCTLCVAMPGHIFHHQWS